MRTTTRYMKIFAAIILCVSACLVLASPKSPDGATTRALKEKLVKLVKSGDFNRAGEIIGRPPDISAVNDDPEFTYRPFILYAATFAGKRIKWSDLGHLMLWEVPSDDIDGFRYLGVSIGKESIPVVVETYFK